MSGLLAQAVPAQQPRETDAQRRERRAMAESIAARGVRDRATLDALRSVPRHEFVPAEYQDQAYADHPLPIGHGQTISQPYIVGYMTEMVRAKPGMKVLEVGTGSGYQAAILAAAGCEVFSIEIFEPLATSARERLTRLGYAVEVRHGDGHFGWPEEAPFDAILVTAAAGFIPPALVDQLKPGGRMLIPVGSVSGVQHLILVQKNDRGRVSTRSLLPVRFVPLLSGNRER
jgi:protein-L-isoaspartate(D-aspartate) O-methyltransferase